MRTVLFLLWRGIRAMGIVAVGCVLGLAAMYFFLFGPFTPLFLHDYGFPWWWGVPAPILWLIVMGSVWVD